MRNRTLSGRLKASKRKRCTIDDISVFKRLDKLSPVYCLVQRDGSNEQTSESIAARVVELLSSDGLVLQEAK